MLRLPRSSRGVVAGWVVTRIFERMAQPEDQTEFVRALVPASLDLMSKCTFARYGKTRRVVATSRFAWRFGKLVYRYLPSVNDKALFDRLGPDKRKSEFMLIVPPDYDSLVREALRASGDHFATSVFSIGDFISWRTMFAPIELGVSSEEVLLELLSLYNSRAAANGLGRSMQVKIPKRSGLATESVRKA